MTTSIHNIGLGAESLDPAFEVAASHTRGDNAVADIGNARAATDLLFDLLDPAAIYARPVAERHRLIFYLGHLEAFDWNLLGVRERGLPPLHQTFDHLFAFGIDPDTAHLPSDEPKDWPKLAEVRGYVQAARERVDQLAVTASTGALEMCIEHRLMHAETLCYLFHNLSYEVKRKPESVSIAAGERIRRGRIQIPAGEATLGKAQDGTFGWDNEYREHRVPVPEFAIDSHKVTNGDYLEFVRAGGTPSHFWTPRGGQWFYQGMFEETPLALDAPVYVTHEQAAAYAASRGMTLPSEPQFHRTAYGATDGSEKIFPWGDEAPAARLGNFNFYLWDPTDIYSFADGTSAFGAAQLVGNGWEWTSTVFERFEGFAAHPYYPGYSADFFDGQHFVLKGASPRTAAKFLRRSFRNWFRPNYPHVYATFRCVEG